MGGIDDIQVDHGARELCVQMGVSWPELPERATYSERKMAGNRTILDRVEARQIAGAIIWVALNGNAAPELKPQASD